MYELFKITSISVYVIVERQYFKLFWIFSIYLNLFVNNSEKWKYLLVNNLK